jgi:mono/diheme cytochrome c family protein
VIDGMAGEQYVSTVPLPLTRAVLERGRSRFDIFCATCHGIDGSGESQVAHNMTSRKPPSLVIEPVLSFPAGRIFDVITHGYGLMPEYQRDLNVSDRWAVVSYLRVLQRSRAVALASLPEAVQRRAKEELP